jgi:hypothetical protein
LHQLEGYVHLAEAPDWRRAGQAGRFPDQALRREKLTAEQKARIREFAPTKSLGCLAAEFGVSDETIRTVLRQGLVALDAPSQECLAKR